MLLRIGKLCYSTDDSLKQIRCTESATHQEALLLATSSNNSFNKVRIIWHEDRSKLHKVSSEYPVATNYIVKALPQQHCNHSSSLHNNQRDGCWHKNRTMISCNWPADTSMVSINHENLRITTPQGEDEGHRVHNDTCYTSVIPLATDKKHTLEKNCSSQLTYTGLSKESLNSSTKRLEDHQWFTPVMQTPINCATQGVNSLKALCDVNKLEKAIEIVTNTLGVALTWNCMAKPRVI